MILQFTPVEVWNRVLDFCGNIEVVSLAVTWKEHVLPYVVAWGCLHFEQMAVRKVKLNLCRNPFSIAVRVTESFHAVTAATAVADFHPSWPLKIEVLRISTEPFLEDIEQCFELLRNVGQLCNSVVIQVGRVSTVALSSLDILLTIFDSKMRLFPRKKIQIVLNYRTQDQGRAHGRENDIDCDSSYVLPKIVQFLSDHADHVSLVLRGEDYLLHQIMNDDNLQSLMTEETFSLMLRGQVTRYSIRELMDVHRTCKMLGSMDVWWPFAVPSPTPGTPDLSLVPTAHPPLPTMTETQALSNVAFLQDVIDAYLQRPIDMIVSNCPLLDHSNQVFELVMCPASKGHQFLLSLYRSVAAVCLDLHGQFPDCRVRFWETTYNVTIVRAEPVYTHETSDLNTIWTD
jgi:hypothetical protein